MKILLSSAKTMGPCPISGTQNPHFLEDAIKFHAKMAKWSLKKIADYHGTSPALSAKVAAGIAAWDGAKHGILGQAALGSFQGEAFAKLDVGSLAPPVQKLALSSVYIGSGLYGLLRGSDGIQPYRLDMDQKWGTKSLRAHWTRKISSWLKEELAGAPLVNLASAEYADALDRTGMHWIDVDFFQESGGKRKAVSVFSKQARGLMARHLCEHYAAGVEAISTFSAEGYTLDSSASSPTHFVFVR